MQLCGYSTGGDNTSRYTYRSCNNPCSSLEYSFLKGNLVNNDESFTILSRITKQRRDNTLVKLKFTFDDSGITNDGLSIQNWANKANIVSIDNWGLCLCRDVGCE